MPLSDLACKNAKPKDKPYRLADGFRVTASTILNARNYDADVAEAVLAHQDKNAIRRTYNHATYWKQRMTLMQQWGDLLDALKAGR